MAADSDPEALPTAGPTAWVVGASGLLGSAVRRRLECQRRDVRTSRVSWAEHDAAVETLLADAQGLPDGGWQLWWCAGAGVVGTSQDELDTELAVLDDFLRRWQPRPDGGHRGFFFASSAGGVYAGAAAPPFTESTEPVAISPYGLAKLEAETVVGAFAARTGVPLLLARLSNLYGPGQDITKPQGLISQLCRAQLTRRPLSIYVSLDTLRDYLFVDDAAAMVVAGLDAVTGRGGSHLKIVASERSTTIGAVLADLHRITRRRPPVVLGISEKARYQVRDLRVRSLAWPPVSAYARTPLVVGMAATLASVGDQMRTARPLGWRARS